MPTPDSTTQALTPIVLIVTVAFGAGILSGLYRRLLPIGLAENTERIKTVTMAISLSCALLGGLIAAVAAGWFLFVRCPAAGTCPAFTATLWRAQLWQGIGFADFPQLAATLYVDRLAALFVLLIAALSIGVSLYSFGWLAGDDQRNRVAGFYNLFVLSLLYVVIANHVFFLILVLEVATLAFGYLILYKHNRYPDVEEHQRAVVAYLIISQLSTILILAAFLILAYHAKQQSGFSVDALSLSTLRGDSLIYRRFNLSNEPIAATLVFLLAFGGLSIRAGAFPLHFWVPLAHPASPTTTHAMSLGIGIKVALYLMLRVFFEFLTPTAVWWGWVVLLVGGLTAAYNVFFAALSHDLKRALAYHSVENIGIMLVGIGLAMAAKASDAGAVVSAVLVQVGLVAALYHLINHAVFKSLLYLCTGIIEKRTGGIVLIQQLGGVWRYYPWTAAAFLIGAAAIAGLPPFNGFISEWLMLAGLFTGLDSTAVPGLIATALGALLLGLAFSLTAVAFVKIAGRAILGVPDEKTWRDAQTGDAPLNMLGVVGVLAGLCLLLGLYPQPVLQLLGNIATDLGASPSIQFTGDSVGWGQMTLSLEPSRVLAGLLTVTLGWVWVRARRVRRNRVWAGGVTYEPRRMQYTDAAFLYLLWERFSDRARVEQPALRRFAPPDYLYARFRISARSTITGVFRRLFNALLYLGHTLAEYVGNHIQNGDIRWYLLYILIAFLVALILRGAA